MRADGSWARVDPSAGVSASPWHGLICSGCWDGLTPEQGLVPGEAEGSGLRESESEGFEPPKELSSFCFSCSGKGVTRCRVPRLRRLNLQAITACVFHTQDPPRSALMLAVRSIQPDQCTLNAFHSNMAEREHFLEQDPAAKGRVWITSPLTTG